MTDCSREDFQASGEEYRRYQHLGLLAHLQIPYVRHWQSQYHHVRHYIWECNSEKEPFGVYARRPDALFPVATDGLTGKDGNEDARHCPQSHDYADDSCCNAHRAGGKDAAV